MQIAYTAEQEVLRTELRAYFAELMTPEVQEETARGDTGGPACLEAVRKMGRDGWLGIGWPEEYGGQGRTDVEQLIFFDEAWRVGAPIPFLTINTVGRTIMEYGTEAQKRALLPKILAGELHVSIGYTEPGAGTDLASLTTRAERDGDEWVINGQKVFTSLASYADYIWLAARTNPDAPKHRGITIFLVPTSDPGFSCSKIETMVNASTYQTFYDDVRVGDDAVVGEVDRGWDLIVNQLNYERVSLGPPGMVEQVLEDVIAWTQATKRADGRRVADEEWVQLNLARVHARLELVKLLNWKVAASGGAAPADASATKVFATEFYTEAYRLLMEVLGPEAYLDRASPGAVLAGRLARACQGTLILTFGGGVNEVQRDLIAMFGAGLPRVPRS
ncbi:MAG TPA: acyl-CoA dehydrogenase family protein [Acidimicrobiales bacterium]|nr:acyl-CoA dehydrogenase family protein [Acidimicrobiales bacterium]